MGGGCGLRAIRSLGFGSDVVTVIALMCGKMTVIGPIDVLF